MEPEERKINHIEEAKKKLYSRNEGLGKHKKNSPIHEVKYGVSTEWKAPAGQTIGTFGQKRVPASFFKKFFLFSLAFFIFAAGFALYKFYGGGNTVSSQNIEISILGNSFARGGEDLPLQIEIRNLNNVPLELADLLVEYPKGSDGAETGDYVRIRKSLGTIKAGETVNENIKVMLFGEQGTVKEIKASLEYRVQGSNAIFVKAAGLSVAISSSPVTLSLEAPKTAVSNQEISLNLKVVSNSDKVIKDLILSVEYPPGFTFVSSSPEPVVGENVWVLGDLPANSERTVSVKGRLVGQDREERTFRAYVGEKDSRIETALGVVYNSFLHTVMIERPFIQARLLVSGQDRNEYSIPSQTPVSAEVRWANNLPTRIDDVEIRVRLSGNALDKRSVSAVSGFYNSLDDSIIWDKNTQRNLSSIEPGETGALTFTFTPLPLFGSAGLISEPTVNAEVSIKGKQPAAGNILQEVNNLEKKVIKVNTDLQLVAKALYYSGPFQNSGPIPPRAEQRTTYAITWTITNTSNGVSGAEARATLPLYVNYLSVTSPQSEDISYNGETKEVTWRLGAVERGAGFTAGSREVSFQVELLPSISQIGSVPQLLSETVLTGTDNFTGGSLRSVRNALSTRLSSDTVFRSGDERVVE